MKDTYSTREEIAQRYHFSPSTVTRKVNEAAVNGVKLAIGTKRGLRINDRLFDWYMRGKR